MHVTDRTTGQFGLQDLGIEPTAFEEKFVEFGFHDYIKYKPRSSQNDIPKLTVTFIL